MAFMKVKVKGQCGPLPFFSLPTVAQPVGRETDREEEFFEEAFLSWVLGT